jgi:hypothetical protein
MVCKIFEVAAKEKAWEDITAHEDLFKIEYEKVFKAISNLTVC